MSKLFLIHELVEQILFFLEKEPKELLSCCQVSYLWREVSTTILWRIISVSTAIPCQNAFLHASTRQISNFTDETFKRICNVRDQERISGLAKLLDKTPEESCAHKVRKLEIKLEFVLEFQIGPLLYLEELDLPSTTQLLAWSEFIKRCRGILDLFSLLPNLSCVSLHINLDIESRSLIEKVKLWINS
jgi:hypothetical protein